MGEVFAAVRTGPGGFRRAVALKRLVDEDMVRGTSVQRFLAEARILSSLHHANVIEIYDVVAADRGYVLVMELLRGATLGGIARMLGEARVPADEAIAIADQALAGLEYIHAARDEAGRPLGLVHRDLTPNNLFVTETGEVKLIDFGIAKLREALDAPVTREGEIHGTLELIAPEQARGDPVDPRSDLYQLAGSLYWALTGQYPHGSGTTVELVTRAAMVQPTPLGTLRPDLPPPLIAAIDRAMALEPADRFADAAAMRAELHPVVSRDGPARLAARVRAIAPDDASAPVKQDREAAREAPTVPPTVAPTVPPTVADRPSARRGEPTVRAPRRRWPIAAATVGALAIAGGGIALLARSGGGAETARAPAGDAGLAVVPGSEGAISATPLPGGRLAIATAKSVTTIDEHGAEARAIAVPKDMVPHDVEALGDGRVALTVQDATGYLRVYLEGVRESLLSRSRPGVFAVRPDGKVGAEAPRWMSAWIVGPDSGPEVVPVRSGHDLVPALAWSPDGARLAAIHERYGTDPWIELVEVPSLERKMASHAPWHGEIAAFGWLDATHLAFAVNRDDGATFYKLDVTSQHDDEVMRLPDERVLAGHVAAGAIAFVHGTPARTLWLGSARELGATAVAPALAVAGFDANGRVIYEQPDGTVVARSDDGRAADVAGAARGDRPVTLLDGDLLALREDVLYRASSASSTRLMPSQAPRGTTVVRCAGDATAPCVAAVIGSTGVEYDTYDPKGGALPEKYITSWRGLDHAISRDGKQLAIVDGTDEIEVYDLEQHKAHWRRAGWGAACEHVAWLGDELVVSVRDWRQHRWALVAIDAADHVRLIAESAQRISAELRASGDRLAVVVTDVAPVVSVLRP